MPATAPCCLMNLTSRLSGSTKTSSQMPRSPTVPQPRRSTLVDSTITSPAPPAANLPAFIRCQSVGNPFTAEYWCIGGTTIRLRNSTPRIASGVNNSKPDIKPDMAHFLVRSSSGHRRYRPAPPESHAFLGWRDGSRRDRRKANNRQFSGGTDERGDPDPAGAKRRAWCEQRAIPEPARVHPPGARQPRPERLGLHCRRRRDRNHDAPQPHGA